MAMDEQCDPPPRWPPVGPQQASFYESELAAVRRCQPHHQHAWHDQRHVATSGVDLRGAGASIVYDAGQIDPHLGEPA